MEEVKKEEWEEWKVSPVTQAYHKFLRRAQGSLMEQWAAKAFQGETRDEVLTLNAAALGEFEAYKRLVDLDYEQFSEVMKDE